MDLHGSALSAARRWADALLARPTAGPEKDALALLGGELGLPFSFRYGSRESSEVLPDWKRAGRSRKLDDVRTEEIVTFTDPVTGLVVEVRVTRFADFPCVEWVLALENTGARDTPLIEDIQPLDGAICCPGRDPLLHYAKGATCSMEDFRPMARTLNRGAVARFTPGGGRSSSDFLPFFNVESAAGEGMIVGIGWSGEWAAELRRDGAQGLRIRAGMALTHLTLHPDERIRTPLMLALFWRGERVRSQNMLRRFLLRYHRPRVDGKPVEMPLFACAWGGTSAAIHTENIRAMVRHELPADCYWIDAEWFGNGPYWKNTGDWSVKKDLYPEGFKPLAEALHESGRRFLLWFEPERVCEGTPWYTDHRSRLLGVPRDKRHYNWRTSQAEPDWVAWESLRNQIKDGDMLLNLADPEARRFLTDFVCDKIREFGLDFYRHDANIAPLEFWREADAPDRQGITEIRWVEGLYAFWDELRERFPGLVIDNCASGGRRVDLETMSRSVPLWRTDYPSDLTGKQCHSHGILSWVPLNATGGVSMGRSDAYAFRSTMSSGLVVELFDRGRVGAERPIPADYPYEEVKKTLAQYRDIQRFYLGDYYPLTEYSQAEDAWMAYQLDLPEEGEGIVVVLKRPRSRHGSARYPLSGVDSRGTYEVRNMDTGAAQIIAGAVLAERGVECELPRRPDSAILRYRRR